MILGWAFHQFSLAKHRCTQCMKPPVAHLLNSTWFWVELLGNGCDLWATWNYNEMLKQPICERIGHGWRFHALCTGGGWAILWWCLMSSQLNATQHFTPGMKAAQSKPPQNSAAKHWQQTDCITGDVFRPGMHSETNHRNKREGSSVLWSAQTAKKTRPGRSFDPHINILQKPLSSVRSDHRKASS